MRQILRYILPVLILAGGIAVAWSFATAQAVDEPYRFELGNDITARAGDVTIEPGFKALADDRFAYEVYQNATRKGVTRDGEKAIDSFRRREEWTTLVTVVAAEDPLEGNTDLLLKVQYERMSFLLDVGRASYSGIISPEDSKFWEAAPDGSRNEVNNIPGWAGINARTLESNRSTQSRDFSALAWMSVSDTGRLYNPTYFADFRTGDQTNYPGRLQDPVQLLTGMMPRFNEGTSLKIGETVTVRGAFPVGVRHGAAIEYDFTYRLDKLYGTIERPTAARFTFSATPVKREHTSSVEGLTTSFTAPDIKDAHLLYDLNKGVAGYIAWEYGLEGRISKPGTSLATDFEVNMDFSASLRDTRAEAE